MNHTKKRQRQKPIVCPGFDRDAHKCHEADFYRDENRRGGGRSYLCKECHKARSREYFRTKYYPENRDELIEKAAARQGQR
jgi:hypothetical protein